MKTSSIDEGAVLRLTDKIYRVIADEMCWKDPHTVLPYPHRAVIVCRDCGRWMDNQIDMCMYEPYYTGRYEQEPEHNAFLKYKEDGPHELNDVIGWIYAPKPIPKEES